LYWVRVSPFFLLLIFWLGKRNRNGLPVGAFIPQVVGQLGRSVCGKKGSSHVEKFTAEHKARSKMTRFFFWVDDDNTSNPELDGWPNY
jgi:hypothetical protein